MNGTHLTLTLAAALAAASLTRRGSLARTAIPGLPELRAAMVQAASEDTAYGQGYRDRRDPLALHCGPVSYVVQRKYGGDILSGKAGNEPHLWNRLPDGTEVDLSGSQYGGDGWGPVTKGRVVPGRRSVNPRFARFASRVEQALSRQGSRATFRQQAAPSHVVFEAQRDAARFRKTLDGRDLQNEDFELSWLGGDLQALFGERLLGYGVHRLVLASSDPRFVIKLAVFPGHNLDESQAWADAGPKTRGMLVPVVASDPGGRWLVMERVTPHAWEPDESAGLKALRQRASRVGLLDVHADNVSTDLRLLDYAEPVSLKGSPAKGLPFTGSPQGSRATSPFTTGYCLAFAKVLKRRLGRGAELYDLVEPDAPGASFAFQGKPHHAVVKWRGMYLDADGAFTEDELLARWDARAPTYVRRPLRLERHHAARAKDAGLKAACPAHLLQGAEGLAAKMAARLTGSPQGSRAHYEDEGIVGGHWGRAGSGVLVTDGARVLLLLRSGEVHTPYVWGYAGGAIPVNRKTGEPMDAKASALHEADEEMGGMPPGRVVRSLVKREPDGFTYTTFVWRVTPSALDDFEPELNWEHDDWRVFRLTDLPSEIHPGALWALRQMGTTNE